MKSLISYNGEVMNEFKKYGKIVLFYCVLIPFAFLWDVLFGAVELLYKGCTWVDRAGGEIIEDLKDYLQR